MPALILFILMALPVASPAQSVSLDAILDCYRESLEPLSNCAMEVIQREERLSDGVMSSEIASMKVVTTLDRAILEDRRVIRIGDAEIATVTLHWFMAGRLITCARTGAGSPIVYVQRSYERSKLAAWQAPLLCGFVPGEGLRIDQLLERINVRIRPEMEKIGETMCHVVDGSTDGMELTVWFAPERGGAIVKLTRRAHRGSFSEGSGQYPLTSQNEEKRAVPRRVTQILQKVEVEQFGSHWLPVRADYEEIIDFEGGSVTVIRRTIERRNILLNPDEPDASYILNIANGTTVRIVGERDGIPWEWRDGKIVPREDKEATARLDALVGETRFTPGEDSGRIRLVIGSAIFLGMISAGGGMLWLWSRLRAPRAVRR